MLEAFQGDDGLWGVCEGQAVQYEPEFASMTAEALADMGNSTNPPKDWEAAAERLKLAGLPF
jgi:hypothetical protein